MTLVEGGKRWKGTTGRGGGGGVRNRAARAVLVNSNPGWLSRFFIPLARLTKTPSREPRDRGVFVSFGQSLRGSFRVLPLTEYINFPSPSTRFLLPSSGWKLNRGNVHASSRFSLKIRKIPRNSEVLIPFFLFFFERLKYLQKESIFFFF